ncbi:hypothetical protein GOV08_02135 [Candidatus Woesearchaeota archaeon]|nr:hypothetical protein [Candidatus Woesearchaeota archaeon]
MESKVEERENPNKKKYRKEILDVAYKFSSQIYKELGTYIKAIVLFGSSARKKNLSGDVDILLVLDDTKSVLDASFMQAYKIVVGKTVKNVSDKLHVTTLKFTTFWEYMRSSDPIAVNILRDGVPLIDSGFFEPMQILLYDGRIRPTTESIWAYYTKAPRTLHNSKFHLVQATLDLYWAVIDSAHAALMMSGEIPPSPEHIADMLEQKLVKTGHLEKKYATIMANFYRLQKMISRRELGEVKGQEYDNYFKDAQDFVDRMKKFLEKKK